MKKNSFFVISFIFITFYFFNKFDLKIDKNTPTPTEYIQKKKDKKQFKQDRKQWVENMHRAAPGIDWKQIDRENRKNNTDKVRKLRNTLFQSGQIDNISDDFEIIIPREIEGTWIERGSNNLAGRIMTADIDFSNNTIYCASAGGNIWKGSIDGENWESLTDYMQLNINFLRIIDTNGGQRLLIGTGNELYYSDNECLTLVEQMGLGIVV